MIHSISTQDHTFSGGWKYDSETKKIFWSQEIFDALELSYSVVNNGESDLLNYFLKDSKILFEKKIAEQKSFDIEIKAKHFGTNELVFLRLIGTPFFNNGQLQEFFGTYQSIDVVLKKLLYESEEKLKSLTNNIPGLICRRKTDEDLTIVYISNDIYTLSGLLPIDYVKKYNSILHLIHPEDRKKALTEIQEAIEKDEQYRIQYRIITHEEKVIWIEEIGHPVLFEYDSDNYVDSILLDITSAKETEFMLNEQMSTAAQYAKELTQQNTELESVMEEVSHQNESLASLNADLNKVNSDLSESTNFLNKITELSPNFIYVIDLDLNKLIYVNKAAIKYQAEFGSKFDFTVNQEFTRDLVHEEDLEILEKHFRRQKNLLEGKVAELTIRLKTDAGFKWVYFRESIFKTNSKGKPAELIGTARDITELKLTEIDLRRSEEKLRETQRISRVGRWEYDLVREEIEFSGEAFRIYGYESLDRAPSPEEYVKNLHEEDQAIFLEKQKELILTQLPYQLEVRYRTPKANYMWILIHAEPVMEGDRVVRIIGSTQDIGSVKKMERKLERLVKTKDAFLSMVSHDLRGPLSQIRTLNSFNNTPDDDLKTTAYIEKAASKSLVMIDELLQIATLEDENIELVKEETDLCLFLNDIIFDYQDRAREKNVDLVIDLPYQRLSSNINRIYFQRVIENVIDNAIKFTPSGGKIELSLSLKRDYISIFISDTGIGIPENIIPVIFDKFSDAQRTGLHGEASTGLGMYICRYIMDLHNGKIQVESEIDKGSVFTVILPRYE